MSDPMDLIHQARLWHEDGLVQRLADALEAALAREANARAKAPNFTGTLSELIDKVRGDCHRDWLASEAQSEARIRELEAALARVRDLERERQTMSDAIGNDAAALNAEYEKGYADGVEKGFIIAVEEQRHDPHWSHIVVQEVERRIAARVAAGLIQLGLWALQASRDGHDYDGGDIQGDAVRLGVVVPVAVGPDAYCPDDVNCICAEMEADVCYRDSETTAALRVLAPQEKALP